MENSGRQKKLTKQQQEILKNNPNVAKVTDYQVWYTQTFKNYFCTEYHGQTIPNNAIVHSD